MGLQDELINIESVMLGTQLKNVQATITSQRRVLALNDSYSKKMAMYTRLVLAIIFALAIAILLKILKDKFQVIPDSVITIVYIILFSSCVIYGIFVISDINSRETTDFDKLELSPPGAVSKLGGKNRPHGFNLGDLDINPGCIGSSCCSAKYATIWDGDENQCKTGCDVGFKYLIDTNDPTRKTCTACGAGTTSIGGLTESCSDCIAGTYSSEGGRCISCPVGTYSGTTKAFSSETCTTCQVGKTSPAGSTKASDCTAPSV